MLTREGHRKSDSRATVVRRDVTQCARYCSKRRAQHSKRTMSIATAGSLHIQNGLPSWYAKCTTSPNLPCNVIQYIGVTILMRTGQYTVLTVRLLEAHRSS
eukprot:14100-Heterococcus_DN1.PRE.1